MHLKLTTFGEKKKKLDQGRFWVRHLKWHEWHKSGRNWCWVMFQVSSHRLSLNWRHFGISLNSHVDSKKVFFKLAFFRRIQRYYSAQNIWQSLLISTDDSVKTFFIWGYVTEKIFFGKIPRFSNIQICRNWTARAIYSGQKHCLLL